MCCSRCYITQLSYLAAIVKICVFVRSLVIVLSLSELLCILNISTVFSGLYSGMMCRVEVLLGCETPRYVAQDGPRKRSNRKFVVKPVLTVVNVLEDQETTSGESNSNTCHTKVPLCCCTVLRCLHLSIS